MAKKPIQTAPGGFDYDDGLVDVPLDNSPLVMEVAEPPLAPASDIDCTGKPKLIFVIGLGQTGKTTGCRLIAERAEAREGTTLASVDPVNRELGLYFDDTLKPETRDPSGIARWLSGFVDSALAAKDNAMVDMGGGDASLSRLWTDRPDLPEQIEAAGIELIALFMLSGRPIDLTPLNDMTGLGFAPRCTALVMNHIRIRPGVSHEAEFRLTVRHPAYRAAIDRGAVPIWMPHLHTADMIRDRHITFEQAATGIMPKGKPGLPLGLAQQSNTAGWLRKATAALSPIDRWLP
jgi:hypothetical protein